MRRRAGAPLSMRSIVVTSEMMSIVPDVISGATWLTFGLMPIHLRTTDGKEAATRQQQGDLRHAGIADVPPG